MAGLKAKLEKRWSQLGEGPQVEAALKSGMALPREAREARERAREDAERERGVLHDEKVGSDADEEKENLEYRELWCSGRKKDAEPRIPETSLGASLADLKERAKEALALDELDLAEDLYTNGLRMIKEERGRAAAPSSDPAPPSPPPSLDRDLGDSAAILYSNRAHVRTRQGRWLEASADAYAALELRPDWAKPYYRIAQAKAGDGDYRSAIAACRQGQQLLERSGSRSEEFAKLMDAISNSAFISGSLAGFDGRLLQVRSAGEEAWLGKEAPANPLIDEEPEKTSLVFGADGAAEVGEEGSDMMDGFPMGDADVDQGTRAAMVARRKMDKMAAGAPLSFRSIKAAVEEARDGDRIILLRGIHNTGGATIFVTKRILIRSEGTLDETTIDHRGNSPIFRITRNCVLQNIDIDMTGFREAVFIYGGPESRPVLEHCRIKCSGEDAINVAGRASPVVRSCSVTSCKKVGLKLYEDARGEYINLRISGCQQQAVRLMERSQARFYSCHLSESKEEGFVAMDEAQATLTDCVIQDNQGPGLDLSGTAKVHLSTCRVKNNVGGLWLWDRTKALVTHSSLQGGSSHVVLADADSLPTITSSRIDGSVQAAEEPWEGICMTTNTFVEPSKPVELPAEEGCFKFEPVWYQRKQ